ncbi:MAG: hypothetical protein EZS28_024155 [Streblomastix strix]|uniref:Uncharacterized protein n=1 Tax=Streblomastix strix TaxID=222440 RepID=A0A5J4VCM1_9EUKA|nr:MAG: hypothetical protein EZS28_024155 [Streblomastix strix]
MDNATHLEQKSVFHHIIVSPKVIPIWDQTWPDLLRRNTRINIQIRKTALANSNPELLRRHLTNSSERIQINNANAKNSKSFGTIRMNSIEKQI